VRAGYGLADAGELRIQPVLEFAFGVRTSNHLFNINLE